MDSKSGGSQLHMIMERDVYVWLNWWW